MRVSIAGLDKAEVLVALYNASKPIGMGHLHYNPEPMTREVAAKILELNQDFDYLHGRIIKIDLSEDMIRVDLYNRDNGPGAAEAVLLELFAHTLLMTQTQRDRYRGRKDEAYTERNRVVAALAEMAIARGWKAGRGVHEDKPGEDWDPEWRGLVVIESPLAGQMSWHYHDSQAHLFASLPELQVPWDGHTTQEKYERLENIGYSLEHDELARLIRLHDIELAPPEPTQEPASAQG